MVELIGDLCIPSELICPEATTKLSGGSLLRISGGSLFMSGAKLHFMIGDVIETVTSG